MRNRTRGIPSSTGIGEESIDSSVLTKRTDLVRKPGIKAALYVAGSKPGRTEQSSVPDCSECPRYVQRDGPDLS